MLNHFAFWSGKAHSYLQFPSQVGSKWIIYCSDLYGQCNLQKLHLIQRREISWGGDTFQYLSSIDRDRVNQ